VAASAEITEDAIAALVGRFYGKARQDPMLGGLFNAAVADWDEHLGRIADFWSSAMLSTGRYKGNPLVAHARHPIEPDFFTRWLSLWHETTAELFAPETAAQFDLKAERIAESLKLALYYRPGAVAPRRPATGRTDSA
jgi:hemoglobin